MIEEEKERRLTKSGRKQYDITKGGCVESLDIVKMKLEKELTRDKSELRDGPNVWTTTPGEMSSE